MTGNRKKETSTKRLFRDSSGQEHLFEKSLEEEMEAQANAPVECLGMTFKNDEARRKYFLEILRKKLKDPEFCKIEGFPIGSDEDILALSDPPYYTACPNPFIEDLIKHYGKPYDPENDNYRREPFAADVSEGKNDPIYNAHSYHTKVPPKAIMRYVLHYTDPDDIVFDGFCGTGMTGVAAQLCGDRKTVESLGYKVKKDRTILDQNGIRFSALGLRRSVLNDLSPIATFIASNYNTPIRIRRFREEAVHLLRELNNEWDWIYQTSHTNEETEGTIHYVVWSDVFTCQSCTQDIVFFDVAFDSSLGKVRDTFSCPHCGALHSKRSLDHATETYFDPILKSTHHRNKQVPVLINYGVGNRRYEKTPSDSDLKLLEKIEFFLRNEVLASHPMMHKGGEKWGAIWRAGYHYGVTHTHHFYTPRNFFVLSKVWERCKAPTFKWAVTAIINYVNKKQSFTGGGGGMPGVLYIASLVQEKNVFEVLGRKIQSLEKAFKREIRESGMSIIMTQSSGSLTQLETASIDYIFVDPPFGSNIMYSEGSFLWESWLKVFTNNGPEAIESSIQNKGLTEYQGLMIDCLKEFFRVLKPGRWMTVEFHNSKNSVWNAIQEALQLAGFVIADVRTLDKKQGSFKQVTSGGAVKQDLIISSYKPNGGFEERFKLTAGEDEGVWDFVRTHLKQLPVFVSKDGQTDIIAERQNYLLFDRMVAFHVQRGITVSLSAGDFYQGLAQRFPERDGMYFLPEQVAEYDKKRMTVKEVLQLELFVKDESSAIQWLKQQLIKKPQTFQEIHPQFLREIGGWQKHEKPLELSELLEENFIRYDGKENVPSQIHGYLSSNFKQLRNLAKDHTALQAKAKDRWYVPDPNKAGDLEKLRERTLLREFNEYLESKQKRLKVFRLEAVRAGFKKAWQEREYQTILTVARKIPENILQEDPKLLMWYDQALTRTGADK